MSQATLQELYGKERQRLIEYFSLTTLYFALFLLATPLLHPLLSFSFTLIGGTLGWVLSQQREQRRLLAPLSRKRLLGDILENLLLLFALTLSILFAIFVEYPLPKLLGYLSAAFWSYFLTTAVGERTWQHRFFRRLSETEQRNYLANLSQTIFLPLNLYRRKKRSL